MAPNFPLGNTADNAIVFPYTAIDLTSQIDIIPNQWGLLGDMGMFDEEGVDTTVVELNYRDGYIGLLANSERGPIPQVATSDDEAAVFVKIPHFPDTDLITPRDLENRWAFVRGDNMPRRRRTLEDEIARRLQKFALRHDLTEEYLRMGALKGRIYDGKGSLLVDLFQTFNITQKTFTFPFSNTSFNPLTMTYDVARYIELNLHGDVSDGVECLCDPIFFNALINQTNVRIFWLNYRDAAIYRGDNRRRFAFGAVTFVEYNAQVPTQPLSGILQQQYNEAEAPTTAAQASGTTIQFAAGTVPAEVGSGWGIADLTASAAIPSTVTVSSQSTSAGTTTVTVSGTVTGVGSGDQVVFSPPNIQRFIEPSTGYAYPSGTRETFRTYYAPPFTVQNIAGMGMKRFVSPKILDHGRGVELFCESNPLPICRRPNVLVKLQAA